MPPETKQSQIDKLIADNTRLADAIKQSLDETKKLREANERLANPDQSELARLEENNRKLMELSKQQTDEIKRQQEEYKRQQERQQEQLKKHQEELKHTKNWLKTTILTLKQKKYIAVIGGLVAAAGYVGYWLWTNNYSSSIVGKTVNSAGQQVVTLAAGRTIWFNIGIITAIIIVGITAVLVAIYYFGNKNYKQMKDKLDKEIGITSEASTQ